MRVRRREFRLVVAGLANGISPREMLSLFILDRSHSDPLEPDRLLRPAFSASLRNGRRGCQNLHRPPHSPISEHRRRGFVESFMRLACGLANGLFDNGASASSSTRFVFDA